MTINLNDFVNQFVKIKLRNGSIYYGVIELNAYQPADYSYLFQSQDSTKRFWFMSHGCQSIWKSSLDIIEIEQVKSPIQTTNSSFLEWFSSEYGNFSFRSEAFFADCEIKDVKILKRMMFKWLQAAYEAGTQCKVEQES
jgi:hypothetical protein